MPCLCHDVTCLAVVERAWQRLPVCVMFQCEACHAYSWLICSCCLNLDLHDACRADKVLFCRFDPQVASIPPTHAPFALLAHIHPIGARQSACLADPGSPALTVRMNASQKMRARLEQVSTGLVVV